MRLSCAPPLKLFPIRSNLLNVAVASITAVYTMIKENPDKLLYLRALQFLVPQDTTLTTAKLEDQVSKQFGVTLADSLQAKVYYTEHKFSSHTISYYLGFEPLPDTELAFRNEVERARHAHLELAPQFAIAAPDCFYYSLALERVKPPLSDYYTWNANAYIESHDVEIELSLLREVYYD